MAAEVMKSFGTLQLELEQAKTSLKDVDEHIKKILGRDPSDPQTRPGTKRTATGNSVEDLRNRGRIFNNRNKQNYENDEHASKKRSVESSVFKKGFDKPNNETYSPEVVTKTQLISKVIVTPKELPSRQQILAAQGADEKSKARNRRMFGALLGTLQKFRQEETKLKQKEEKRAQVEKKLEEQQIREREEMKKERQDLFLNRRKKQQEIRMIELKMSRLKQLTEWEEKQRPLMNFIETKAKPHIYFLPKILNDANKTLLENNKKHVEKKIDKKRQDVFAELTEIENRMKRNFNNKQDAQNEEHKDEFTLEDEDVEIKEDFLDNTEKEESTRKDSTKKLEESSKHDGSDLENNDNNSRQTTQEKIDETNEKQQNSESKDESKDTESEKDYNELVETKLDEHMFDETES